MAMNVLPLLKYISKSKRFFSDCCNFKCKTLSDMVCEFFFSYLLSNRVNGVMITQYSVCKF